MSEQSLNTYTFIGGRLHAEQKLLSIDENGNPPMTHVDFISGETYVPRVVGYTQPNPVTGVPEKGFECVFYLMATMPQEVVMQALSDVLLRLHMKAHGREIKIEANIQSRPSSLITPGGN